MKLIIRKKMVPYHEEPQLTREAKAGFYTLLKKASAVAGFGVQPTTVEIKDFDCRNRNRHWQ